MILKKMAKHNDKKRKINGQAISNSKCKEVFQAPLKKGFLRFS